MIARLDDVLEPIQASAVSIEGAFLRAGDGLSRGLDSFEALKTNIAALGERLVDNGMEEAVASLEIISRHLATVSDGLPRDRATLEELVACNKLVAFHVETLIENMRMMTILARSARIEAVVFDRQGDGFVDFTQEIMALIRNVHADIARCARDHLKLSGLVDAALKAQLALERAFRDKLIELARELEESLSAIRERRQTGVDLMGEVGRRADAIASAARTAIMSLQAGDSTRQRLEHVHYGLSVVLGDETTEAVDDDRLAKVAAMCRLQRAQLNDAVSCFDEDILSIDGALGILAQDTRDLVSLGKLVYGDGARGSASFLDAIKTRIAKAAEHIGTCEAARTGVDQTVSGLRTRIDELNEAVTALSGVVPEIVLIGLNAGLKAGRFGAAGRSVVVIAQELKELASAISEGTETLLPVFATLKDVSGRLAEPADRDGASGPLLTHDMGAIVTALGAGGAALGTFLAQLEQDGNRFEIDVDHSRREFAEAAARNLGLLDAADLLENVESEAFAQGVDAGTALGLLAGMMGSTYTMAREREIHTEIVGSHFPVMSSSVAAPDDQEAA